MKKGNLIIALILEGLGILVIIDSYRIGLQSFKNPGAGLFPFLLGIALCLITIPTCLDSLKGLRKVNIIKNGEKETKYWVNSKKLGTITACVIGYFLLLDTIGFLTTTFLFMFILYFMGSPQKKWLIFLYTALTVGFVYLIFIFILQIPFPRGFLR